MMELCMRNSPIGVSEMDVKFSFCYCKMTVVVDSQNYKDYNRL